MAETRTSVRFPPGWHDRVRRLAKRADRSVHAEILHLIGIGMESEENQESTVTLKINEDEMISPDTPHIAKRINGTSWLVTWLRADHRLTRNQAITAMTIASVVGATKRELATPAGAVDSRDPIFQHINSWASELGLDGAQAVLYAAAPPKWQP